MTIPKDLLDALMKDYKNPEDLLIYANSIKQSAESLLTPHSVLYCFIEIITISYVSCHTMQDPATRCRAEP